MKREQIEFFDYAEDTNTSLLFGDCKEKLGGIASNSIDAIVTDPPYGLGKHPDIVKLLTAWMNDEEIKYSGFMNKDWDYVPGPSIWKECYRVLKPGGHMLVFAGTRTVDLMGISLRMAGFEIRDMVGWLYGSGFPKNHDISKAIDRQTGAERMVVGKEKNFGATKIVDGKIGYGDYAGSWNITAPSTDPAKQWNGWGSALKPAIEPILLVRKPISEKTIADNVLRWGTGAINIDGSRVNFGSESDRRVGTNATNCGTAKNEFFKGVDAGNTNYLMYKPQGRWPANLILSYDSEGKEAVMRVFPETAGKWGKHVSGKRYMGRGDANVIEPRRDSGSASRYFKQFETTDYDRAFYVPKASKVERNRGLEGMEEEQKYAKDGRGNSHEIFTSESANDSDWAKKNPNLKTKNFHPTVKPIKLMQYLIKLITPPGGTVLDPFMGSGTTGIAAKQYGFDFVGIEKEPEYIEIARARMKVIV